MPFIRRKNLSKELKEQGAKDYRETLRKALLNPTLTSLQRQEIRKKLQASYR